MPRSPDCRDVSPCLCSFLFDLYSGRVAHVSRTANALKLPRVLDLAIEEVAQECAYRGDDGESTDFIPCRRKRSVDDVRRQLEGKSRYQPASELEPYRAPLHTARSK